MFGKSITTKLRYVLFQSTVVFFVVAGLFALAAASECHSIVTRSYPEASWLPSLIYGAVLWFWWAGTATLLWQAGERWPFALRFSLRGTIGQVLFGSIITFLHLLLLQSTVKLLIEHWPYLGPAGYNSLQYLNFGRFSFELLLYGFLLGICGLVQLQLSTQRSALRSAEMEKQLIATQLQVLQMQIEPHFLLNTLNAITALVELGEREHALETLSHLNTILKSTLKRTNPEKVPLAQELAIVENYLAIEQVRFSDRLQVQMDVDPNALDGLVPCFLLQPIVENAVRHGIAQCEEGGLIEACAKKSGGYLHLWVRDNGPGVSKASKTGSGLALKNTRERLAFFYGEDHQFQIQQPLTGGFHVSITIPYERRAL